MGCQGREERGKTNEGKRRKIKGLGFLLYFAVFCLFLDYIPKHIIFRLFFLILCFLSYFLYNVIFIFQFLSINSQVRLRFLRAHDRGQAIVQIKKGRAHYVGAGKFITEIVCMRGCGSGVGVRLGQVKEGREREGRKEGGTAERKKSRKERRKEGI